MKKILFLLLFTSAMYGQIVPTGQEQDFDYGIKNTASQLDDNAVFITVQNSDGVQGKSTSSVWAKKIYVDNADVKKSFLSTGLINNGLVQANADPTKFNITAGIGIISNFDDPENPTSTIVNFPAFIGITPTYLTTSNITYIAINSSAAIVQQATPFTNVQRRDLIALGAVIHSNLSTINLVNNISAPTNSDTNQLHDLMEAIGALNVDGNKIVANNANLSINKTAGDIFKLGVNFANDWKNPHKLNISAQTPVTFRYRTQNGTEGADVTALNPALYDVANVLTSVPSNKFSIQTVTLFQTGAIRVQYGQATYATLSEAESAINTRTYNVEPNIAANGITRAYIILKNTATSLQNASDTKIVEAGKFGNVGGSGGAITLDAIVAALGFTPENVANKQNSLAVDGTGTKYPTVDAVKNSVDLKANDADVVHKTGDEAISDTKQFNDKIGVNYTQPHASTEDVSVWVNKTSSANVARGFQSYLNFTGTYGATAYDGYIYGVINNSYDHIAVNQNTFNIAGSGVPAYGLFTSIFNGQYNGTNTAPLAACIRIDDIVGSGSVTNKYGIYHTGSMSHYLANNLLYDKKIAIGASSTFVPDYALTINAIDGTLTDWRIAGANFAYTGKAGTMFSGADTGFGIAVNLGKPIVFGTGGVRGLQIQDGTTICGTSSPNGVDKLLVDGSVLSTSIKTSNAGLGLTLDKYTGGSYGAVYFSGSTSSGTNPLLLGNATKTWLNADTGGSIALSIGTSEKLNIDSTGTATFSSTISATSYIGGAALTGTPTAPTAAPGTNTTQIATTAFVQAADASSVKLTGSQTVNGIKTFTSDVKTNSVGAYSSDVLTLYSGGTSLLINDTDSTITATGDIVGTAFIKTTSQPNQFLKADGSVSVGYRVYTALLTQTGTNAPTATVLENTLGTVVWTRNNTGQYIGTLTGAFTDQKTIIFVNRSNPAATAFDTNMAANVININTVGYTTFSNSAYVDGQTNSASIEIRVYN